MIAIVVGASRSALHDMCRDLIDALGVAGEHEFSLYGRRNGPVGDGPPVEEVVITFTNEDMEGRNDLPPGIILVDVDMEGG